MLARDEREKAALEWATQQFRYFAAHITSENSKRTDEEFELRIYTAMYDRGLLPERAWVEAKGSDTPALRNLAAILVERGDSLPQEIRRFVARYLRDQIPKPKRKSGRPSDDLWLRNGGIFCSISLIRDKWNFPATRNEASEHSSAASIVVKALQQGAGIHLTESAVNQIWREWCAMLKREPSQASRDFFDLLDFLDLLPDRKGEPSQASRDFFDPIDFRFRDLPPDRKYARIKKQH